MIAYLNQHGTMEPCDVKFVTLSYRFYNADLQSCIQDDFCEQNLSQKQNI